MNLRFSLWPLEIAVFRNVTQSSLVHGHQNLKGTFYPEGRGILFHQNVGTYLSDYIPSHSIKKLISRGEPCLFKTYRCKEAYFSVLVTCKYCIMTSKRVCWNNSCSCLWRGVSEIYKIWGHEEWTVHQRRTSNWKAALFYLST